jgi:formylmethanofuran dehydrogenase subunit B
MHRAWIRGKPVSLEAATAEAASLLGACRLPVIAGLGTDIAGARAAIALADRLGAAVDHMHSDTLFRDLDVMREAGLMVTTPNEARLRADTLLLIGTGLVTAWPELRARLLGQSPIADDDQAGDRRRIVWLAPGPEIEHIAAKAVTVQKVGRSPDDLPVLLAALRARLWERSIGGTREFTRSLDRVVGELKAARFGVAVWCAADLDSLAIEMLCGLVKDLNVRTRFSGLSLAAGDNAFGVMQACGWMMGFPVRTGFARGYPEHDPWRFDSARLIESGEADCALWISAYRAVAPTWRRDVPIIALTKEDANFPRAPHVNIEVGRPGIDHDAVQHRGETGTLAAVTAGLRANTLSVADAIAYIAMALPKSGAWPC